ncbi:hypothetical protein D3C76_720750 [compost metagenome]
MHQTFVVGLCDLCIGLGQHHLQHVDPGAEERPLFAHLRQQFALAALQGIVQSGFPAQPGWQHQARLGPAEDPRDGSQTLDAAGAALGRAAAQRQAPQLLLRRRLAEILDKIGVVAHHAAIRLHPVSSQLVHHLTPGRLRRGWR